MPDDVIDAEIVAIEKNGDRWDIDGAKRFRKVLADVGPVVAVKPKPSSSREKR